MLLWNVPLSSSTLSLSSKCCPADRHKILSMSSTPTRPLFSSALIMHVYPRGTLMLSYTPVRTQYTHPEVGEGGGGGGVCRLSKGEPASHLAQLDKAARQAARFADCCTMELPSSVSVLCGVICTYSHDRGRSSSYSGDRTSSTRNLACDTGEPGCSTDKTWQCSGTHPWGIQQDPVLCVRLCTQSQQCR